jgi:acetaldehyde dehydrogenase (acetylating)
VLWDAIKEIPTVGVVRHDPRKKLYDIAWPMGVVAALTPSTNPTSTVIFKILIAVKARNAIVVAPHPSAAKCCVETARLMAEAGERAGMPPGLVACMSQITLPGTQELMRHKYVALILATGGSDMVKAAHSVGKPAYGVGPGNVPVYVDRSADLRKRGEIHRRVQGVRPFGHLRHRTGGGGRPPIAAQLGRTDESRRRLLCRRRRGAGAGRLLFTPGPLINPKTVGKSPQQLAQMAGIRVPATARILVARLKEVGAASRSPPKS